MKYLKDWLVRLKSRPVSGDYWEDHRHHQALETLAACDEHSDWLTLSCHGNGFVREVAVRELSERPSPEALGALLERLNDWVAQVRRLAADSVRSYLSPEHVHALLYALPSLMALADRQRADHSPTLATARAVLQSPDVHDDVVAAFVARHGKPARFLFALLLEASDEPTALLRQALAHREMTVRQMAVSACQALAPEQARPLLLEALQTPGASVRVSVLRALLSLLDDPRPALQAALLDASPAVRSLARWAAPRWQVDAHAVLAERLRQPAPTRKRDWLGLLGLACELAVELDEPWPSAALRSPLHSVRLAAVSGLAEGDLTHQLMALDDTTDKVFTRAAERLSKQPWSALEQELDTRLDRDWHALPPARRAALMHLRPRWQQLAYLLRRLDTGNAERDYWLAQVATWCQRQYMMIDPSTPKAERAALLGRVKELENDGALPAGCAARIG